MCVSKYPSFLPSLARWLPLLLSGIRETDQLDRFLAIRASSDLVRAAGASGALLPLLPSLVAPLRAALLTRIKPSVCGALKLLQQMLDAHPHAGRALRPYYDRLLIPMALYALTPQSQYRGAER